MARASLRILPLASSAPPSLFRGSEMEFMRRSAAPAGTGPTPRKE